MKKSITYEIVDLTNVIYKNITLEELKNLISVCEKDAHDAGYKNLTIKWSSINHNSGSVMLCGEIESKEEKNAKSLANKYNTTVTITKAGSSKTFNPNTTPIKSKKKPVSKKK